ncbi:MAG: serine/threonine-protein kinase, partial [Candidatus Thermoplasmatota archaeon]|nr:serine/threonine-protein kinase [Candidatus Thermoplasmatota archaeon]
STSHARRQAKAYAVAFGTHDALYFTLLGASGVWPGWFDGTEAGNLFVFSFHGGASLIFGLLLARGILGTQLFDIELKVRRTVKQGTVVAILALTYVVTNLAARSLMSPQAAQNAGVVLTGLLLFALVPLQRLGTRVADAAMPGVRDTPEYVEQRKLEVYGAALEDALAGASEVPEDQEARLAQLRAKLGLSDRDHAVLLHAIQRTDVSSITPSFEPGRTVLDRYRIEEVLGQGGQGTTYRALDTRLGRAVVLKTVHRGDARSTLREARALAAIHHPNVVAIHDVERVGDHVYLVMEHVDGGSLAEVSGAGSLPGEGFADLASDLLSGLEAVHDAGLIHRDVKPSNVLLTLDGQAKLADLGIATDARAEAETTLVAGAQGAVGTVAYMSPEQARGDRLSPASDQFSAAATLYRALTGRSLFEAYPGEASVELQARVAAWRGFQEDLDDPGLEAWFAKALAPSPSDRFTDATAMLEALDVEGWTAPEA